AHASRRKVVGGVMLSVALTAFITGITEPLEYAFAYVAFPLYAVHAVLTGTSLALVNALASSPGSGSRPGPSTMCSTWAEPRSYPVESFRCCCSSSSASCTHSSTTSSSAGPSSSSTCTHPAVKRKATPARKHRRSSTRPRRPRRSPQARSAPRKRAGSSGVVLEPGADPLQQSRGRCGEHRSRFASRVAGFLSNSAAEVSVLGRVELHPAGQIRDCMVSAGYAGPVEASSVDEVDREVDVSGDDLGESRCRQRGCECSVPEAGCDASVEAA